MATQKLDSVKLGEIERMRFSKEATLYVGEADFADIKGIATPSDKYELAVTQDKARWVFAFRDREGRTGTLTLARPAMISVFEVDPRGEPDRGLGPGLYKEWRMTSAAAGTGVFVPGTGGAQKITLILHGRGNSCTDVSDFGHWTIVVHGPKAQYSLFGELLR